MKRVVFFLSYILFFPCLLISCMLFYSYIKSVPYVEHPPYGAIVFLLLGMIYPALYFFYQNKNQTKARAILKKIGFSSNTFSLSNHIDGKYAFIDPVRGEFLIIINGKISSTVVKGYNFQQWGGYDYDGNGNITLKFNDFEFPSITISQTKPNAKEFCNKLDIMCSPSYSPKDERSFYKHVQQSLATA